MTMSYYDITNLSSLGAMILKLAIYCISHSLKYTCAMCDYDMTRSSFFVFHTVCCSLIEEFSPKMLMFSDKEVLLFQLKAC